MKKLHLPQPILNKIIALGACLGLLLAIFLLTDPNEVSLAVLLVPFLLIGYTAYACVWVALNIRPEHRLSGALMKLVPLNAAFLVVALLLLSSLGQLTVRDSLLVVGFTGLFLVYIARADFLK